MTVLSNSQRIYGAFVAAAIALVWTAPPLLYGFAQGSPQVVQLAVVWLGPSVPVAATLAFLLTPWAVRCESESGPALAMAFFPVLRGAPAVSVLVAAASEPSNLIELFGLAVFFTIAGLILLGWAYLLITIPSGYIWAVVVRRKIGITT